MEPIEIVTPRLQLRLFDTGDVAKVFRMSREPLSMRWLPSQVYGDEAEATAAVRYLIEQAQSPRDPRRGPFVLGIVSRDDGELIGHVGLSEWRDEVEVGYAIEESRQGRGFATEAVRAACAWGIEQFGLERILGITSTENVASQRVLIHAGFVLREEVRMPFQGVEEEVSIFELVRKP